MANPKHKLSIAILGTRGIPARYGGFETFAEELSVRLAARGHSVIVYKRHRFGAKVTKEAEYRGVNTVSVPTIMHKYFETPLAAAASFLDLFKREIDVVLLCNAANSPFAWLGKLRNVPVAINVDGIERNRAKWNTLGKLWYRLGERCSILFGNPVIADAKVIAEYYRERYKQETTVIAYGAEARRKEAGGLLRSFNLTPGRYILYVSRLEPENNALGVIEAYNRLETDMPLVIVGDAPYADQYKLKLEQAAGPNVIFTGYQFADAYYELQSNCYLYIQATEVGGTHPALIEAMAYGNCVVANGTPENMEVLADCGKVYAKNQFDQLSEILASLIRSPEEARRLGELAKKRAMERYNWDSITAQYEELFLEMSGRAAG